jgi:hypothetical protein
MEIILHGPHTWTACMEAILHRPRAWGPSYTDRVHEDYLTRTACMEAILHRPSCTDRVHGEPPSAFPQWLIRREKALMWIRYAPFRCHMTEMIRSYPRLLACSPWPGLGQRPLWVLMNAVRTYTAIHTTHLAPVSVPTVPPGQRTSWRGVTPSDCSTRLPSTGP